MYIIQGESVFRVDLCQLELFFLHFHEIFPRKVLVFWKKAVPLHPLSGTHLMSTEKEFFEKIT